MFGIKEILPTNNSLGTIDVVTDDGDIVPVDRGEFIDQPSEQDMIEGPEEQYPALSVDEAFRKRNKLLGAAAQIAAAARRDEGAVNSGRTNVPGYRGATERSQRRRQDAEILGAKACEVCPLYELCPDKRVPDSVFNDQPTSKRFRDRIGKGSFEENKHLCRTNTSPDRLKDSVL